jgi:enoyl-CoA hydratase/carnithine racemase
MSATAAVLHIREQDAVAFLSFNRAAKRNAINDEVIAALDSYFSAVPEHVRVVVLSGEGGHFSSGLDLSEQAEREPHEVMAHSRNWHRVTGLMREGRVPIVAAMAGAVMGGGLEIAACCHVRVAEAGSTFRMPEGQRGIFVGGGATVRLSAIIGADRLAEMMLTGRSYGAEEALALGIAHHLTPAGGALDKASARARGIAGNSRTVNTLVVQAIGRIARMPPEQGLYAESLAAALSQTGPDAAEGLKAFLEKRKPDFR